MKKIYPVDLTVELKYYVFVQQIHAHTSLCAKTVIWMCNFIWIF